MILEDYEGLKILKSTLFSDYNINHLFTTIKDETINIRVDYTFNNNEREEILLNYKKIADYFNVPLESIVKSTQIHEANIVRVNECNKGMGITKETKFDNADGIYTLEKNIPLCIFSADCVPVLIGDKNKKAVLAVHAGWRGTAKNIVGKAIKLLKEEYKIKAGDILCAIGPAIGECCFEVSKEVIDEISLTCNDNSCWYKKANGKYQLDLKKVNFMLLKKEGVKEENIDLCDLCTKCEDKLFHSYRRERENAGRNAAFIML